MVDTATLREDHGKEKAAIVEKVLSGKKAPAPEDMVRARFSACKAKDPVFMGRTEKDTTRPKTQERVRGWACTFGLEARTEQDGGAGESERLLDIESLEIIDADGLEVEFKINCGKSG